LNAHYHVEPTRQSSQNPGLAANDDHPCWRARVTAHAKGLSDPRVPRASPSEAQGWRRPQRGNNRFMYEFRQGLKQRNGAGRRGGKGAPLAHDASPPHDDAASHDNALRRPAMKLKPRVAKRWRGS
jgi:hypothetical protein